MLSDSYGCPPFGQSGKQEYDDGGYKKSYNDEYCYGRSLAVLTFRVEPMVVDFLQFAGLFQARVLVINHLDQLLVVTDNSQFAGRDVYLVEHDAVKVEFLNLTAEGYFSPDIVFESALVNTCQTLLWRMILHRKGQTVPGGEIGGRIVVFLDNQRVGRQEVAESVQGWGVDAPCHL